MAAAKKAAAFPIRKLAHIFPIRGSDRLYYKSKPKRRSYERLEGLRNLECFTLDSE